MQVPVGQPAAFDCPLVPNPFAIGVEMSWSRFGGESLKEQRIQLLENGHRLRLLAARKEDAGRFICSAENLAGNDQREFELTASTGRGGQRHSAAAAQTIVELIPSGASAA